MTNDPRDVQEIWQAQPAGIPLDLDEIRRQAGKFRTDVSNRNVREYAAYATMIIFFGISVFTSKDQVMTAGYIVEIAGLMYAAWQLHRRASPETAPSDWGSMNCLAFHRAQLVRQRDALRDVWRWYLGPLIPGFAVICAAGGIAGFRQVWWKGMLAVAFTLLALALVWWIGRLNLRAARKLDEQIASLDRSAGE